MKNKSYIGISFIILVFGIWVVKELNARYNSEDSLVEIGSAPSFKLTNHLQQSVSNQDYLGKVYVVEFFFSTCPTICPIMNQNMLLLQEEFLEESNFGIASFTINPETDTAEVLKQHASHLGVKHPHWHFLTGDRSYIFEIANKGFNLFAGINPEVAGGFEHSGLFALIDQEGNIRSRKDDFGNPIVYYDGLEASGIKALKEDIHILLKNKN
jgi:protein SCO1/2